MFITKDQVREIFGAYAVELLDDDAGFYTDDANQHSKSVEGAIELTQQHAVSLRDEWVGLC